MISICIERITPISERAIFRAKYTKNTYLFLKRGQGRILNVASLFNFFSSNKKRRQLAGYCLRQMGNDTVVLSEET